MVTDMDYHVASISMSSQQQFGLVGLGSSSGSFIIDAYPVSVHPEDIILIFFTVLIVGFLAVWYPVRYFAKRLLS